MGEDGEMGEEKEIFKRSKKIKRTPDKMGVGRGEMEEMLREMRRGIRRY